MGEESNKEYHYVLIYDTGKKRWYMAEAGDFFPSGYIWDNDTQEWMDWDETYGDEGYARHYQFMYDNLTDYNVFADAMLDGTDEV